MFKIISPVCSTEELKGLIRRGADEFYFGVLPGADPKKTDLQINRRPYPTSNFGSVDEAAEALRLSHRKGRKMFLTLNEHVYNAGHFRDISGLAKSLWDAGVDGFFVANVAVIRMLAKELEDPFIIASVGTHIHNDMAARFYERLGVRRIILPRHMLMDEIRDITENSRGLEFEVFIHNFFCDNIDGLCQFSHGLFDSPRGDYEPACLEDKVFTVKSREVVDGTVIKHISDKLSRLKSIYTDNCGLCRAYEFSRMNIHGLKIVGRDNPTGKKMKDVMVLNSIRDAIPGHKSGESFSSFVRGLYRDVYGRECGFKCIYGR